MTQPLPDRFSIRDDFPAAGYDAWRRLVEEGLHGESFAKRLTPVAYEGFPLEPLYALDHAAPARPAACGSGRRGVELRQSYACPDPAEANRQILDDLAGGVDSIELELDAGLGGHAADAVQRGVRAARAEDWDLLLGGVPIDRTGVALRAGEAFAPAAAMFLASCRRRNVPLAELRASFQADPLGVLAERGGLPLRTNSMLAQMGELAAWTCKHAPRSRAVAVNTAVYHRAGATAVQDLALLLATGVSYLRTLTAHGLSVDDAARQIAFAVELGTHHFKAIAKLRAARRLWRRVIEASGGSYQHCTMLLQARAGRRVQTRLDPQVNMLRGAVALYAGMLGGADIVTSVPFDSELGATDTLSRRVARNTAHVLQDESHLARVADPAGGSWFLETLTQQLADAAWGLFQQIERFGGMQGVLESGWIAQQLQAISKHRMRDVHTRKQPIVGVSEFPEPTVSDTAARQHPLPSPAPPEFAASSEADISLERAVQLADEGANLAQIASRLGFGPSTTCVAPIEPMRLAEPFEAIRDVVDTWAAEHGHRPKAQVLAVGPRGPIAPRVAFAEGLIQVGGFEVDVSQTLDSADDAAAAFAASGASIAVLCGADALYPALVPQLAPRLKQAGARSVVLAGNPGDHEADWREAGVDSFIYVRCDVPEALRDLMRREGVLEP
ncbi:Methylmalonyl-CoA mutase small subunit [Pirellulimonas nuda]|uniref:Methylmalonyl-CoA mutase small subunit n=1 Tax=Pirellulimonas nuda TaxID=2528009 RepID=A0A518DFV6_9BACT|nr:methylmalonyl-CoA mutase family protein [Pirellulimonas nuda]QDU90367.1 Methylmalonyl-CoA mutase small subunit [Pirellulimonas nuda]